MPASFRILRSWDAEDIDMLVIPASSLTLRGEMDSACSIRILQGSENTELKRLADPLIEAVLSVTIGSISFFSEGAVSSTAFLAMIENLNGSATLPFLVSISNGSLSRH